MTGKLRPHGYWPDYEAMGDCVSCGNVYDIPQHKVWDDMAVEFARRRKTGEEPRFYVQPTLEFDDA